LQKSSELSLYKTTLLVWISHVSQRRAHVKGAAGLALEQHVIATQVYLCGLAGGAQLFEMTVAKFSLCVFLIAHGLRISDPLRHRRSCGCGRDLIR
jgi:hypothetical protein